MSLRSYFITSALALALVACGASRPGPLKFHFDDMYIARVPLSEKQSVLDAQQEWSIAKMELASARQLYQETVSDVKIAKNEAKKAKLEKQSLKERLKIAEKTGDLTMINETTLLARAADLTYKAAKKKVKYLQQQRKYLRLDIDYHEDMMYEEEARFEMSKARTAQTHNIQPPGFVPAQYQKQLETRSRYAQRTRARVDKARAVAARTEKEWHGLEGAAQAAESSAYNSGKSPPADGAGGAGSSQPAPAGTAPANSGPINPLYPPAPASQTPFPTLQPNPQGG